MKQHNFNNVKQVSTAEFLEYSDLSRQLHEKDIAKYEKAN